MTTTTRRAGVADIPALLTLMVDFNRVEDIPFDPVETVSALERLLEDRTLGFVLVIAAPQLVGYAVTTYNYDLEFDGRDAFITEVYIQADHRRRGLARRLMIAVEAEARRCRVHALHLMVRPENEAARLLYTDVGYEQNPRVVMTKVLEGG